MRSKDRETRLQTNHTEVRTTCWTVGKVEKKKRGQWGKLRVYMLESRQAGEETRVIPLSGPARQSYS